VRSARKRQARGNVFVARDQAYRFRLSDNGFSALVVGSKDAGADHDRFIELGMSGGDMLTFSRPMKLPDGSSSHAKLQAVIRGRSARA
jgi:hypothetical protein